MPDNSLLLYTFHVINKMNTKNFTEQNVLHFFVPYFEKMSIYFGVERHTTQYSELVMTSEEMKVVSFEL